MCESDALHHYLWANYQQFNNQMAAAQHRYNLLLSSKNPSLHTHKGYLYFLHKTNQFGKIIDYASLITSTFAQDPELQLILVHALQKRGLTAQANKQLLDAYKTCPLDQQIVLEVAQLYITNKELRNALEAVDAFLNAAAKKPTHFVFHFLKAQIYTQLNQSEQALISIKECLNLHNTFDKGWLIKAMLEEQCGELEAAIEGYSTFLELTGNSNRVIAQHLIQLTAQQKRGAHRRAQAPSLLDKALTAFDHKQYSHALAQVNLHLHKFPQDTNARLLKIEILTRTNEFTQALTTLTSWIMNEPKNQIWFETLHLVGHKSAMPGSVLEILTTVATKHPDSIWAFIYAADIQMRMKAHKSAITLLEAAQALITDPTLKTKVLFQLGVLHFEQTEYTAMHRCLQQGLALNPQFLPVSNLLAYYYATKGKDINQAHQLITAVIAKDPDNPHYRDTQALIEYKKNNLSEAKNIFEKIHKQCPHDATIALHLAKTLHKLGQITEARTKLAIAQAYAHSEYEKRAITKLSNRFKSEQNHSS